MSEKEAEALKAVQSRAEEIQEQLKQRPDDLDAKQTLSDLATALGDYKRARALAEQVVQAQPQNSKAWLILVSNGEETNASEPFCKPTLRIYFRIHSLFLVNSCD